MKKSLFLIVVFSLQITFAQQDLINELASIKYNTKSFNLKKNVKELIIKRGYISGIGVTVNKIYKYNFDRKGNLISETYYKAAIFDNNKNIKKYKFDTDNRLLRINIIKDSVLVENNYFSYTKKGKLQDIIFENFETSSKTIYEIRWKKNKPIKYLVKDNSGNVQYESFNHTFNRKKYVTKYDFNESGDLGTIHIKFNKKGLKTYEAYTFKTNSDYNFTGEYTYNKFDDILSKTEDNTKITFEYTKYDKNDNWTKKEYQDIGLYMVIKRELTYY